VQVTQPEAVELADGDRKCCRRVTVGDIVEWVGWCEPDADPLGALFANNRFRHFNLEKMRG
jgi:hypothetical protein